MQGKFDVGEMNIRWPGEKEKQPGISKKKCALMTKKVQLFTCGGQIIFMYYEYREKQICSVHGDATFQRLQISKETQYVYLLLSSRPICMGEVFHGRTQPHHKLSTITHTTTSIERKTCQCPEICAETEKAL